MTIRKLQVSKQNRWIGTAALVFALCAASATPAPAAQAHQNTPLRGLLPTLASAVPGESMVPDQVNTAGWDKAWTNLVNDVEQTFVPSMPRLLGVEVELILGNRGKDEDELTLTILDSTGETAASVTQTVPASKCEHTLFVISNDGIEVTPGETYRLKLSGGITFGWKYVVGGYPKGAATFNGKPLLPKARSTFQFRTFGAE